MASVKELMWDRLQVPTHAAENDTYQTDLYKIITIQVFISNQ